MLCCTAARPVIATTLLVEGRPRAGGDPLRGSLQRGRESALTESTIRRSAADTIVGDRRRPASHLYPQQPGPRNPGAEFASRRADQLVAARGGARRRRGPHRRSGSRDSVRRIRPADLRDAEHRGAAVRSSRASRKSRRFTRRVQGLMGSPRPIVWDMRIATSSIPRETLDRILSTAVKPDDLEGRLQIVRLYFHQRALSRRRRGAGKNREGLSRARRPAAIHSAIAAARWAANPPGDSATRRSRATRVGPWAANAISHRGRVRRDARGGPRAAG